MKSRKVAKRIRSFTAFFDRNHNGYYTVTVPSLPGLVTEGRNIDHARLMAEDAIKCYVEGLKKDSESIPEEAETAQMQITVSV